MTVMEFIITTLGILGVGGGGAAWFLLRPQIKKLKAEAGRAAVEAEVAEDRSDDEHLKTVVEYVIKPLKQELQDLRTEVVAMRAQMDAQARRYRSLLGWTRKVFAWQQMWHPNVDPPLPSLPPDIADEI